MKNFLTLKNLSVLSKNDFCIIGKITDCIFDLSLKKIAYFLCIKDASVLLLPPSAISSFGDVVVVDDLTDIRKIEDVDFTTLNTVVGKTVYTNSGVKKGVVLDVVCSGENVTEFVLEDTTVKPNEVQGVGEIVLLKAPAKRKRKKKADFTALANKDTPVEILAEDTSTGEFNENKPFVYDEMAESEVNAYKNKVALNENAEPTTINNVDSAIYPQYNMPPRIISDYNFLLGRILTEDLFTYNGELIAYSNTPITINVVERARLSGKLLELTLNSK